MTHTRQENSLGTMSFPEPVPVLGSDALQAGDATGKLEPGISEMSSACLVFKK